ncbi:MAG: delta 1-pyrroline-5-carboxylate reductase, partial [Kordiimonas sp.]
MSTLKHIAIDEWRYWRRSKIAVSVLWIGIVLVVGSALLTTNQMIAAFHEREHLQTTAEDTFLSQPDRHPHRMVHYGHYAFR